MVVEVVEESSILAFSLASRMRWRAPLSELTSMPELLLNSLIKNS